MNPAISGAYGTIPQRPIANLQELFLPTSWWPRRNNRGLGVKFSAPMRTKCFSYHQAKYMNEITAAGKAEFPIPYYINVWLDYPAAELPQRQVDMPGIAYPSGGAVQKLVGLWRALAPSIDMIGPDIYADDSAFYRETMRAYHRADNPLWIPETGRSDSFGK